MTVTEMHTAFRLNLDKSSSLVGNPDFLPEEIDFWLNEAQERFIKQRLFGNNYRHEGLDASQKRIDDLKNLIVNSETLYLQTSELGSNVKETVLSQLDATYPYLFYINSTLFDSTGKSLQTGDNVKAVDISKYLKDSINNPYIRRPLTYFATRANFPVIAFIYGDEFVPNTCNLTYIKKPKVLTLNTPFGYQTNTCELSEETHKEIVAIAVGLVIENIESPRVQTFNPLSQSNIE